MKVILVLIVCWMTVFAALTSPEDFEEKYADLISGKQQVNHDTSK